MVRSLLASTSYDGPDPTDREIDDAIAAAERWIAGRRWSRIVVAVNVIRDGHPHA